MRSASRKALPCGELASYGRKSGDRAERSPPSARIGPVALFDRSFVPGSRACNYWGIPACGGQSRKLVSAIEPPREFSARGILENGKGTNRAQTVIHDVGADADPGH